MYNLRYHIASLVAVFLALAVGLLLGTVVAERGTITDQTTALVGQLQERFDEITAENDVLELGLERDRAFAQSVVGPLTDSVLAGTSVAVVAGPGASDALAPAVDTVVAAGGSPVAISIQAPSLGLDVAEPEGLAGYFQLHGAEMAPAGDELVSQVAVSLAAEWRAGAARPLTELLVSTGLLAVESTTSTAPVNAITVVGVGEGCDPFALALARAASEAGSVAVGAESVGAAGGVASVFASEDLSAVDHLATAQGRFSLVWLLSGRASGYFGGSDGADAYYPEITP